MGPAITWPRIPPWSVELVSDGLAKLGVFVLGAPNAGQFTIAIRNAAKLEKHIMSQKSPFRINLGQQDNCFGNSCN